MNWAVGRSWVQYPTRLPAGSNFPCAPITADLLESTHPHFAAWERLEPIEAKLGRRIPVVARVPGVGLLWNLAEGMDVRP